MKTFILYPFDTGCLYKFDFKGTKIKTKLVEFGSIKYRSLVYKFGTGIIEIELELETTSLQEIKQIKFSQRSDISDFSEKIANMTIKMLEKDVINTYPVKYQKTLLYPVFVSESFRITPSFAYINNEEILDIIEYALAQYWNLLSFDYILNQSLNETVNILEQIKPTINIFSLLKKYKLATKEASENLSDSTEVIMSITNIMEEIPNSYNPEYYEYYEQIRKTFGIDDLKQRVITKLEHIKELYSFVRETIGNWLFFIIELTFIVWFAFEIITFILTRR